MNTFNLGLVFGEAEAVVILVCASEKSINKQEVNRVATKHFQQSIATCKTINDVSTAVVDGIKQECECDVVAVTADVACAIPRK